MKRIHAAAIISIAIACIMTFSGCGSAPVVVNNYYVTNSDGSVVQTQPSGNATASEQSNGAADNTTSTDESLSVGTKYTVTDTKNYLALRNAPAYEASNEIAKLKNGDEVFIKSQTVYGDKFEYCYVTVISGSASGKEGYVNKNYLKKGPGTSNNSGSTKPSTNGTYTVYTVTGTTNYLGVRTAPVYDGNNIIYKLNNGDQVYVYSTETYGDKGEYWYISVPNTGTEGYANKNYLKKSSETPASSENLVSNSGSSDQQMGQREKIISAFKAEIGDSNMIYFLYDDFDGNGIKEAYVITGTGEPSQYSNVNIYFVSSNCQVTLRDSDLAGYLLDSGNGVIGTSNSGFVVWIENYGGSGSTAHIYGVRNGSPYEPQISGQYNDFYKDDSGNYVAHSNDFSTGAHTYPEHYFSYDPSSGEFYEITSSAGNVAPAPSNSSQGSQGTAYTVTGTSNYLAIRSAPVYDESNVIGKLNNGATVVVNSTETYGDKCEYWYVTDPNSGTSGYANKKYLK